MTEESDLLAPGDVLALERGVPRTRWNAAVNQRVRRVDLLGRLSYHGDWVDLFDARFVSDADSPVLDGRPIIDLEVSVLLAGGTTLAVGDQNVFDTFSDRNDVRAGALGVPLAGSRRGVSAAGILRPHQLSLGPVRRPWRLHGGCRDPLENR